MMHSSKITMAALFVGLAFPGRWLGAAPDVRVGLWETTVQSIIEGMPMSPPPMTHRSCINEQDLVPHVEAPGQECQVLEHTLSGNSVNWRIQCSHEGMTTSGTGSITYTGDQYQGTVEMIMQGGQMGTMKMTQNMTGRRIGDCP